MVMSHKRWHNKMMYLRQQSLGNAFASIKLAEGNNMFPIDASHPSHLSYLQRNHYKRSECQLLHLPLYDFPIYLYSFCFNVIYRYLGTKTSFLSRYGTIFSVIAYRVATFNSLSHTPDPGRRFSLFTCTVLPESRWSNMERRVKGKAQGT